MGLTDEGLIRIPGMASRWVRLANGAKAHYATAGDEGPAVILLHGGLPGSSGMAGWRFMAPVLAANGFRVYCPDQPGFGWADTAEEYRPTNGAVDHVRFIDDFATAMCLDKFSLAGNSMGCINTVHYVVAHPERVTSFALIAGGVGDLIPLDMEKIRSQIDPHTIEITHESMKAMMNSIIYRPAAIDEDLVAMRLAAATRQQESWAEFWKSNLRIAEDPNLSAAISTIGRIDKITIPAIYLYGMDDVLIPVEEGYRQEDLLPNIQFFYPEECGHQGQSDQPELFAQTFLEFFRDGRVSRSTADSAGVSKRRAEIPELVQQA